MVIYDNYDNKYDNTMSCLFLSSFFKNDIDDHHESLELGFLFTLSIRSLEGAGSSHF
jgi:hypothetical protein